MIFFSIFPDETYQAKGGGGDSQIPEYWKQPIPHLPPTFASRQYLNCTLKKKIHDASMCKARNKPWDISKHKLLSLF